MEKSANPRDNSLFIVRRVENDDLFTLLPCLVVVHASPMRLVHPVTLDAAQLI